MIRLHAFRVGVQVRFPPWASVSRVARDLQAATARESQVGGRYCHVVGSTVDPIPERQYKAYSHNVRRAPPRPEIEHVESRN